MSFLLSDGNDNGARLTAAAALVAAFTTLIGLVVWIVRKMLETTIPGMQTSFQQSLDNVIKSFREEQAEQRRVDQARFDERTRQLLKLTEDIQKNGHYMQYALQKLGFKETLEQWEEKTP
jgi:hypothetical protein